MKRLEERGAAMARGAQRRTVERIVSRIRETVPWIRVEAEGDRVVMSGRRLVRRWLNEASLRFITGLMR